VAECKPYTRMQLRVLDHAPFLQAVGGGGVGGPPLVVGPLQVALAGLVDPPQQPAARVEVVGLEEPHAVEVAAGEGGHGHRPLVSPLDDAVAEVFVEAGAERHEDRAGVAAVAGVADHLAHDGRGDAGALMRTEQASPPLRRSVLIAPTHATPWHGTRPPRTHR
jgi:hypothetical protein